MCSALFKLLIDVLTMAASFDPSSKDWLELAKVIIGALGPIIAALIVGIAGALITNHYASQRERTERDALNNRHKKDLEALQERYRLDKEAEWRSHAVELTKLEIQRKLEAWKLNPDPHKHALRPVILDFLAVYRDLIDLDKTTPRDLYLTVEKSRIKKNGPDIKETASHTEPKEVIEEGEQRSNNAHTDESSNDALDSQAKLMTEPLKGGQKNPSQP